MKAEDNKAPSDSSSQWECISDAGPDSNVSAEAPSRSSRESRTSRVSRELQESATAAALTLRFLEQSGGQGSSNADLKFPEEAFNPYHEAHNPSERTRDQLAGIGADDTALRNPQSLSTSAPELPSFPITLRSYIAPFDASRAVYLLPTPTFHSPSSGSPSSYAGMDSVDIPELVDRLSSREDAVRKMAVFKLQSNIGDPSFAEVFIQEGGLRRLKHLTMTASGNTLAYSLTSFSRLLEVDKGWDLVEQDLVERVRMFILVSLRFIANDVLGG